MRYYIDYYKEEINRILARIGPYPTEEQRSYIKTECGRIVFKLAVDHGYKSANILIEELDLERYGINPQEQEPA